MKYKGADLAVEINGNKYYYERVGKRVSNGDKKDVDVRVALGALNTLLEFRSGQQLW